MLRSAVLVGTGLALAGAAFSVWAGFAYEACLASSVPHCAPGTDCPLWATYCPPEFLLLGLGIALVGVIVSIAGLRFQIVPIPR